MRTQVGIVGAGPAGLMLSHLLHLEGIESIIVEKRSRAYCEARVRAGLMEHWASQLLIDAGLGDRMKSKGIVHHGINISFDGTSRRIDFANLVQKYAVMWEQKEVVTDLIERRLADKGTIFFDIEDTSIHDISSARPNIHFRDRGQLHTIECDFVAGCDGFHGVCRPSLPAGTLTEYSREYPFGWLGILSKSQPPRMELTYATSVNGFALYSNRGPSLARLSIQCPASDDIEDWPDARIWQELHSRSGAAFKLAEGEIIQKGITLLRSFVSEPMQYGRVFLAGDAAHIVPPTGAKGMNLALADVRVLSRAIEAYYRLGRTDLLEGYSASCLKRVWRVQRFSWWMTQALHRFPTDSDFDAKRQVAEIEYLTSSKSAAISFAENFTGLPVDGH